MSWFPEAQRLKEEGLSYRDIADKLSINYNTLKSRFRRDSRRKDVTGVEEITPEIAEFEDYFVISSGKRSVEVMKTTLKELKLLYCGENHLTINQICRKLNIPRRDFMLIRNAFGITHDDVPYIDEDLLNTDIDELVDKTLERQKEQYFIKLQENEIKQLKNEVKKYRRQEYYLDLIRDATEEFFLDFAQVYTAPQPVTPVYKNSTKMLEVPIVDLHLGKLAWSPETGEDYDHKIAQKRFMNVINDVIARTSHLKFEKILFPVGNDFFNFDTISGTTTAGTLQNNDLRWQKLYTKGMEMLIQAVDLLNRLAPVHVFNVPGNHDKMISFYAVYSLYCWFRKNKSVFVDTSPMSRKYVEFGKCLIGYTHLDKEKKRIEGNMQVEAAEAWGRTKYREWHGAHLHSEHVKEVNGIKIRNLSSVTGTDAWHYESGYVGALAVSQSFIWDKHKGLTDILYSTVT